LIVASGLSDFAFSLVLGLVISVLTYFSFTKLKLQNLKGQKSSTGSMKLCCVEPV
jgi:hypothetical protein